ncbi:TetR family transcriptional regulator [Modestobacter sp. SSW1-42]|uniref:acyl-CoA-like ligand-binding transcription factor n=1 Tax=Modestobacter sp. SSW1-42 TaxID=596372 RepID=UPI00398848A0
MRLFLERGYGATTVELIAAESQVSRSSVFRYWGSKSDIVWSEFDVHTERLRELLRGVAVDLATMDAVRQCVVENLRTSMEGSALWLERFAVLDSAPELRAEEHAHWVAWAEVVAAFVAERHGHLPGDVVPQSIGGAVQSAFLAVLRRWLATDDRSGHLPTALDTALTPLCEVLQGWLDRD